MYSAVGLAMTVADLRTPGPCYCLRVTELSRLRRWGDLVWSHSALFPGLFAVGSLPRRWLAAEAANASETVPGVTRILGIRGVSPALRTTQVLGVM